MFQLPIAFNIKHSWWSTRHSWHLKSSIGQYSQDQRDNFVLIEMSNELPFPIHHRSQTQDTVN